MNLQESGEMYLETILVLSKKNKDVRSIDIARELNYSKPSVSRAIGLLKKDEYIIGVCHDTAVNDACRIEHVISDETMNKINEHMKQK